MALMPAGPTRCVCCVRRRLTFHYRCCPLLCACVDSEKGCPVASIHETDAARGADWLQVLFSADLRQFKDRVAAQQGPETRPKSAPKQRLKGTSTSPQQAGGTAAAKNQKQKRSPIPTSEPQAPSAVSAPAPRTAAAKTKTKATETSTGTGGGSAGKRSQGGGTAMASKPGRLRKRTKLEPSPPEVAAN